MERVLILGCDGYIGTYLVRRLMESDYIIGGFDLTRKKATSQSLSFFLTGDLGSPDDLRKAVLEFDPHIIVDLAANADVVIGSSLKSYEVNYVSPKAIKQIASTHKGLALRKIIFTSSQYVIGPEHSGLEKFGYAPHTTYGISKVILEQEVFEQEAAFLNLGIEYTVIRPTNVWGGKHPKYSKMWERLLTKSLVVIPSRKVTKAYCHITTLCELYEKVIAYEGRFGNRLDRVIYGSDELLTQSDWVSLQVNGFRSIGVKAGFFEAPLFCLRIISRVLSMLCSALKISNPLPASRVDSMSYSYIVNLSAPKELRVGKSKNEIADIVKKDLMTRVAKSKN